MDASDDWRFDSVMGHVIKYKATKRKDGTVSLIRTTRKLSLAERLAVTLKPNAADVRKRKGGK